METIALVTAEVVMGYAVGRVRNLAGWRRG